MFKEDYKIIGAIFCYANPLDTLRREEVAKAAGCNVIELRYDTKERAITPDSLHFAYLQNRGIEIISTCMTKEEGGHFEGTLDVWAVLLKKAINHGTNYISIGLEQSKTKIGKEVIEHAKKHEVKIIIGVHGQNMPSEKEIIETLKEIKAAGADIAKVAYKANNPWDVLEIMKATLYDLDIPKIMIATGELGKFWRAVSLLPPWNCWGMFAYIDKPTGEGQLSVEELKEILEILTKR